MSIGFISGKKEFTTSYSTTFSTSSSFTTTFNTSRSTNFTTTFNTSATVYENNGTRTDTWWVAGYQGANVTEGSWLGTTPWSNNLSSIMVNYVSNTTVTVGGYTYYRSNHAWFNSGGSTFYYMKQRSYQTNSSTSRTTSRTTTFSTSRSTTTSFNTSRSTSRTTSFYA